MTIQGDQLESHFCWSILMGFRKISQTYQVTQRTGMKSNQMGPNYCNAEWACDNTQRDISRLLSRARNVNFCD